MRNSFLDKRKGVVLGRVACLGKDLFHLHPNGERNNRLINQQKMRVDRLLELMRGKRRCRPELIRVFLSRDDIYPLIEEQSNIPWLQCDKVKYVLMDSFSELTDQLFVHRREGWAFCCHYSDIVHSDKFEEEFECHGLLQIESIERQYREYFDWFAATYPNIPVFFLNFPATLDTRNEFKERAVEIARAIEEIAKTTTFIHPLSVEESEVIQAAEDTFPYHFDKKTHMAFLRRWNLKNGY